MKTQYEVKHSGQVFTPDYLVNIILDEAGYCGPNILKRHCMDNSCGDGAFLCAALKRYVDAYRCMHHSLDGVAEELAVYIHGIELDERTHHCCLNNLRACCTSLGIDTPALDVVNADALTTTRYRGQMDYVVGNPPYVRVHNLNKSYDSVKAYSFAADGMTDIYIVFFELGFQMLRRGGTLAYITPSSWLGSLAGSRLRDHIRRHQTLRSLIDLGHFQPFRATTYTLISTFTKDCRQELIAYHTYDGQTLDKVFVENLPLREMDIDGRFYLAPRDTLARLRKTLTTPTPRYVTVKNGFATLADKVFIRDRFDFSDFVIPVIKASTGKWHQAFFPYDSEGRPEPAETLFARPAVALYLREHKSELQKGTDEQAWYLYGRTQALRDVSRRKLAVNTTIKDVASIKLNIAPEGSGVYSGLYVLTDMDMGKVCQLLATQEFVDYIASLKKYKSGGYYTFNSKELERYLNYHIHRMVCTDRIKLPTHEKQGLFVSSY